MLSYLVSVSRRKSVCFDRSLSIVLAFCCIRVPKIVPLLELFSSKGGTFQFQRRNFLVPAEELGSKETRKEETTSLCGRLLLR